MKPQPQAISDPSELSVMKTQAQLIGDPFAKFIQTALGMVCTTLMIGALCVWLISLPVLQRRSISFDPSWERMVPMYVTGMTIMFCGLVRLRLPKLREEAEYGVDLPLTDEDTTLGRWIWFVRLLPPVEKRSERYLWSFALLGTLITFVLRDQSLNWMISTWGFRNPYTNLWDATSLICAPLSGAVLTIRFLAIYHSLQARFRT